MKKHLIIIDDDPIYRFIAGKMIRNVLPSIDIHDCENGLIGIQCVKSLIDESNEIIVLLDINMPVMDGWAVLEEIKTAKLFDETNVLIYMVSSSTDKEDISRSKSYGFVNGFVHKPLSRQTIYGMLHQTKIWALPS